MKKDKISKRKWILIPIETKARELFSKVLFACAGAEKGFGVIIGGKPIIRGRQADLPRGMFIEKSIAPGSMPLIKEVKANNNRISAWCEEGLIYLNKEDYKERRVDLESFDAVDYFFVWGKNQADDMYDIIGKKSNKIILSGNPRFDLLRPEIRDIFIKGADKIRKKYGKIILLNTKFATVNSNAEITDYIEYLRSKGKIKTKEGEDLMRRWIALNKKNFHIFLDLVSVLAEKYKNYTIVIRPHPSENHDPWIERANKYSNVKVIFEGSANEWISASEIMIHNNCTTGVEAFMLEKPAISYRPIKDEVVEHPLPDLVSYQVDTQTALLSLIDDVFNNKNNLKLDRSVQVKKASKYIANIDGQLACDRIMGILEELDLPKSEAIFPLRLSFRGYLKKIKNIFRYNVKKSYSNQKFPSLKFDEVRDIFEEFKRVTNRFKDVKMVQVGEDSFCFY